MVYEVYDKELQINDSLRVQYRKVDLDKSSLCNSNKKYSFFPGPYQHQDGSELCKRFGGQKVDITFKENLYAVVNYLLSLKEDTAWNIHKEDLTMYTTLTDEEQFNVWKNYKTGELSLCLEFWRI